MLTNKKEKGSNFYFGQNTEDAIIEFQEEPDIEKKKDIFVKKIRPSFEKLVENIIFVYKFHTLGEIEILKSDCVSFLLENIYKFDKTRRRKAFSYFNVIAKHWFIQEVKKFKRRNKLDVPFDKTLIKALEEGDSELAIFSFEDIIVKKEFMECLRNEMIKWREKFTKLQEKRVLEAIIFLFENPDAIPIYNKKAIYLYIREITGLNTKQIVTNLMKFKRKYGLLKKKYLDGEV